MADVDPGDSAILALNTGSSSIKLALFAPDHLARLWSTSVAGDGAQA